MITTGNTILITGGGSGIGRGLAHAFHDAGNVVIVAGRRPEPLQETIAGREGMNFKLLDVTNGEAIARFAAETVAEHPGLNVLVNNAGVMMVENLLAEPFDLTASEATITTNLLGPIRLTAALLPHLRKQAASAVMNVTSALAFVPLTITPTYNATKAALHAYSESLRFQLRDTPVQVIEVLPPAVATDLRPGHAENPHCMPLDDFIRETMDLLKANPDAPEICVERAKSLRYAEAEGQYDKAFAALNEGR